MYGYIHIFPKNICLEKAGLVDSPEVPEDVLLRGLPDRIFDSTLEYVDILEGCYLTADGWLIPVEFTENLAKTVTNNSSNLTYNDIVSSISTQVVIGRDPWIMKIDTETSVVQVNPIVIDNQIDNIVKDILHALNGMVVEELKRTYGKQQNVSEM